MSLYLLHIGLCRPHLLLHRNNVENGTVPLLGVDYVILPSCKASGLLPFQVIIMVDHLQLASRRRLPGHELEPRVEPLQWMWRPAEWIKPRDMECRMKLGEKEDPMTWEFRFLGCRRRTSSETLCSSSAFGDGELRWSSMTRKVFSGRSFSVLDQSSTGRKDAGSKQ